MNFSFNGNVEAKVAVKYQDKCDLQLQANMFISLSHILLELCKNQDSQGTQSVALVWTLAGQK